MRARVHGTTWRRRALAWLRSWTHVLPPADRDPALSPALVPAARWFLAIVQVRDAAQVEIQVLADVGRASRDACLTDEDVAEAVRRIRKTRDALVTNRKTEGKS